MEYCFAVLEYRISSSTVSQICHLFVTQPVSDGTVLLKGKAGERPVEFSVAVDSSQNLSPIDAALPIHRLAAKAQIKQLEDGEKGVLLFLNYSCCSR